VKIGLDDRFFNTYIVLTLRPSNFDIGNNQQHSRPFEFIAGMASVLSVVIVLQSFTDFTLDQGDPISNILKDNFINWITIYIFVVLFSVVNMHVDIFWFGLFRDKSKPRLTYIQRLSGSAYLSGWYLLTICPFIVFGEYFIFDNTVTEMVNMAVGTTLWLLQLVIARELLNFDQSRYFRFMRRILWVLVLCTLGLGSVFAIWDSFVT